MRKRNRPYVGTTVVTETHDGVVVSRTTTVRSANFGVVRSITETFVSGKLFTRTEMVKERNLRQCETRRTTTFQRFFDGKHVIEETVTIHRTGNSL